MAERKRIDEPTGTETVGHEWDGIEELDTPMPRWWLWTLYATIAWAVVYTVLYPAWPMVSSATAGTLGWSSRGQLEAEMKAEADRNVVKHPPVCLFAGHFLHFTERRGDYDEYFCRNCGHTFYFVATA